MYREMQRNDVEIVSLTEGYVNVPLRRLHMQSVVLLYEIIRYIGIFICAKKV